MRISVAGEVQAKAADVQLVRRDAYVWCRNTSIWQWALSGAEKKKRMAALEVEGVNLLGTELARHSNNMVEAVPEVKAFEDLKKGLGS